MVINSMVSACSSFGNCYQWHHHTRKWGWRWKHTWLEIRAIVCLLRSLFVYKLPLCLSIFVQCMLYLNELQAVSPGPAAACFSIMSARGSSTGQLRLSVQQVQKSRTSCHSSHGILMQLTTGQPCAIASLVNNTILNLRSNRYRKVQWSSITLLTFCLMLNS